MKNLSKILFLCGIIIFSAFSCDEENDEPVNDDNPIKSAEGYIVGFDPCSDIAGFVIITTDLKDTLATYNLSDSLYQFPDSYFANTGGVFPDSARFEFKIDFTYRFAKEEEVIYYACPANIVVIFGWYICNKQIIIKYVQSIN